MESFDGRVAVGVSMLAPTTAFTRMPFPADPVGRLGRPEDVARAVLFLSAAEASYITGTMLHVDGGFAVRGF